MPYIKRHLRSRNWFYFTHKLFVALFFWTLSGDYFPTIWSPHCWTASTLKPLCTSGWILRFRNSGTERKKEVSRGGNLQCTFRGARVLPSRENRAMHPLSSPSTALHRQPWFWGGEFHTDTRGQLVGREKLFHSHLISPAFLIKQAATADLWKNHYPAIPHSRAVLLLQTKQLFALRQLFPAEHLQNFTAIKQLSAFFPPRDVLGRHRHREPRYQG